MTQVNNNPCLIRKSLPPTSLDCEFASPLSSHSYNTLRTMFTSLSVPYSLPSSLSFSLVAVKTPPVAAHIVPRRDLVSLRIRASKNGSPDYRFHEKLKSFAKSAIIIGAAVSMTGKLSTLPAKAESPVTTTEEVKEENFSSEIEPTSPLTELLESTP